MILLVGQLDGGGGTSLGNYALRTRRNDPIHLTNVPPFSVEIRGLRQLPFRMLRMSGPPETPKPKGKMETEDTPQKKIGRPKGSKTKEKKKLTKKAETPTALTALTWTWFTLIWWLPTLLKYRTVCRPEALANLEHELSRAFDEVDSPKPEDMGEPDQEEDSPTPEKAQVQVCRSIEGSCPTVFFARGCLAYLAIFGLLDVTGIRSAGNSWDGIDLIFFAPFTWDSLSRWLHFDVLRTNSASSMGVAHRCQGETHSSKKALDSSARITQARWLHWHHLCLVCMCLHDDSRHLCRFKVVDDIPASRQCTFGTIPYPAVILSRTANAKANTYRYKY